MIKIEFSQKDIDSLHYERFHYPHPAIQKRMEVVYLKSQGFKHKEISRVCVLSEDSIRNYLKTYSNEGIEGLKHWNYKGQKSELLKYQESLEKYFREHPPRSTAEAQAVIEKQTGIKRSPSQIRLFLKKIGMKFRKVGFVPGKATDPSHQRKQEAFIEEELKPRLEEAEKGTRTLFS